MHAKHGRLCGAKSSLSIVSTRGGFILETNKLEKKTNQKNTSKAKQRATKKTKKQKEVQPKKHKQNKEQPRNQNKNNNQKNTSKTQRVVWRGRVGVVLDKGLFWCLVKCRTFSRFSWVPGLMSHFWSSFFGAGSEVSLLVAFCVFPGPGKKSRFWSVVFVFLHL